MKKERELSNLIKSSEEGICEVKLCKLEKKAVASTRILWEEVFCQDSKEFVEYYYQYKAEKNTAFVLREKEQILSMVHLTPYQAVMNGSRRKETQVSYIVGVATKEAFRHKGYMKRLLDKSLLELYKRKEPFAFLMPANPEIYRPFSFEYIYERKNYCLNRERLGQEGLFKLLNGNAEKIFFKTKNGEKYAVRLAADNDGIRLADFAGKVLTEHYDFYLAHTESYFQTLFKEIKSQKGGIFLIEKAENAVAYFVCAMDGIKPYFQEILCLQEELNELFTEKKEKQPIIMARIIHIEAMLILLESCKEKELFFEVTDKDIPFNCGCFYLKMGKEGNRVIRVSEEEKTTMEQTRKKIQVSIKELTEQIFKGKCGNTDLEGAWDGIYVYRHGMINEIV